MYSSFDFSISFPVFFIPPPLVIYLLFALVMFSQRRRSREVGKNYIFAFLLEKKSMFLFNWLQFSCTVRPSTKQLRFAPLVCRTTQDLVTCFPEGSRPLTRITENTSYALHNLPHKSNTPEIFITRPLMTLSTQSFKNISMYCE